MPKKPPAPADKPDFETQLQQLEALVARLERGDLPLEQALADFEQGVALARQCQAELSAAQQRVEVLVQRDGEATLEPFEQEDADAQRP
ncbi:MAG: exodeoxyribonuclease small subunit [Pseudomonadota bacterium]|jgi:exodeoxyribonuclease VII small subunit